MNRTTRIRITELNPHVICVLCGGYFINATTITECLHSFCRTCITRYLETSKYCPVCDVMVHKTRPLDYIRSDKTLQDLVYKLVPGLYKNEMKRRRDYYAEIDPPGVVQTPSEDRGDEFHDRIIYTEDEKISLSLELCAEGVPFKTPTSVHGHTGPDNIKIKDVRYLQCPAAFSIGNLKKFIRMKFDLKQKYEMDIFHTAEPLPDHYSLMDIAYIYTWTRRTPLRLFYTVFERKLPSKAFQSYLSAQTTNVTGNHGNKDRSDLDKHRQVDSENVNLQDGPGDVSFDLELEKTTTPKHEKKKRGPRIKKKAKKQPDVDVEDSVKEAMSESEEQLAKLTLDCSRDAGKQNSDNCKLNAEVADHLTKGNDPMNKTSEGDGVNRNADLEIEIDRHAKESLVVETRGDISKTPSAQTSPGSINLSLFQPLNTDSKDCSDKELVRGKTDNLYDFRGEEQTVPKVTKRGRPKGSKNKVKRTIEGNEKTGESKCNLGEKTGVESESEFPKKKKKTKHETSEDGKRETDGKKESTTSDEICKEKVKRKYVRKVKAVDQLENGGSVKRLKCSGNEDCHKVNNNGMDMKEEDGSKTLEVNKDCHVDKETVDTPNENFCDSEKSETDRSNKTENSGKESVHNLSGSSEHDQGNSKPSGTNSLLEPVTPLYGETPNVSESNQGLPCSPKMEGVEMPKNNNGSLGDMVSNTNETNNSVIDVKDNTVEKPNNLKQLDVSDNKESFVVNGRANCVPLSSVNGAFVGYESSIPGINCVRHELPTVHFSYQNGIPGHSSANTYLGNYGAPIINPHGRFDHMIRLASGYVHLEQSHDQPLDLTNNVYKEEYTKGKIFKTKMLKKMCPKTDSVTQVREKTNVQNGVNPYK